MDQDDGDFWASAEKWFRTARIRNMECVRDMLKLFNDKKIDLDQFGKLSSDAFTILKEIHLTTHTSNISKDQIKARLARILSRLRNLKNEVQSFEEGDPVGRGSSAQSHGTPAAGPGEGPGDARGLKPERRNQKILVLLANYLMGLNRQNMGNEKLISPDEFVDNCDLISKARLRLERLQQELGEELNDWIENQLKILSEEVSLIHEKLEVREKVPA